MGILNDLETLIDDANDTLTDLNGLIGQLQEQYPPTWCAEFDFSSSNGGWSTFDVGASYGSSGWGTVPGYGGQVAYIQRNFPSREITEVRMEWSWSGAPNIDNGFIRYGSIDDTFAGSSPRTKTQTATATNIKVAIGNGTGGANGAGPTGQITRIVVKGNGTLPSEFSTYEC